MKKTLVHLLAGLAAATLIAQTALPAAAADITTITSVEQVANRSVRLPLNKSMVIDLPEAVQDVMVSNPQIADAVVRSNRKIYLVGIGTGETNVFLFGEGNRQLAQFELVVSRDTLGLEDTIAAVLPQAQVRAQTIGEAIVLTGRVSSPEDAAKAGMIAAQFIGDPAKVVNSIEIAGSDQVNLRVVIAEVQRNTARQLGIDFSRISGQVGEVSFAAVTSNPFSVAGAALTDSALNLTGGDFQATIRALQKDGVLRSLAEPNLTAVSGESASFRVGGEVPIPASRDKDGELTYVYKEYGVGLDFTPVVLSPGRISLKIKTDISELDNATSRDIFIGFKSRRAETTVELPSGGAIAIGGLVKDDVRTSINGIPVLMDLPVLGSLFKSRDFQRQQTEFVVFVTPYTVDPVPTAALQRPDKNFALASDAKQIFLNQVNRVYSAKPGADGGTYHGRIGFSFD